MNPNVAEIYRRKVTRLADALADSQASQEAASAIRSLIGDVVLTPGERRGEVNATLRGELMAILDIASWRVRAAGLSSRVITNAVASPRFEPTWRAWAMAVWPLVDPRSEAKHLSRAPNY